MTRSRTTAVWLAVGALTMLAASVASPQTKPSVKIGYLPADSFSALFILADRHLPAAGVAVEMVRLSGGPEVVLESMQRLGSEHGFLKYKELLPPSRLFNFAYRDRAVAELGKK